MCWRPILGLGSAMSLQLETASREDDTYDGFCSVGRFWEQNNLDTGPSLGDKNILYRQLKRQVMQPTDEGRL